MKYAPQIESLIADYKANSWKSQPFERAIAIATESSELLPDFIEAIITELPNGGTFFDAALSFLPVDQYPDAIKFATDAYCRDDKNEAAESVVSYASLQCVEKLRPHLRRIFDLGINNRSYVFYWPWRRSGASEVAWLREVIQTSPTESDRNDAWLAILETRLDSSFDIAMEIAGNVPIKVDPKRYLYGVGFESVGNKYRRLHPNTAYHIQFLAGYIDDKSRPFHLRTSNHPTWLLDSNTSTNVAFGGTLIETVGSEALCEVCGTGLHHLITIDPIPVDLGVTNLARLSIATCLSCISWEEQTPFYQHDFNGSPSQIGYNGPIQQPKYPSSPLTRTTVKFATTPDRWLWQDWAQSNSRENLNRVGGSRCFIQGSEHPRCPICQQTMTFLLQLDSDLPTEDGLDWMWGSGGIGYVFWCDGCKVSGISAQWT